MTNNVAASDVERTLDATELSTSEIDAYIDKAERLYDQRIDGESVDTDPRDDVIEALAAHLIASGPERQLASADDVSFEGSTGEGLMATTHGQMAILLDPTGQLDGGEDGGSDDFTLST